MKPRLRLLISPAPTHALATVLTASLTAFDRSPKSASGFINYFFKKKFFFCPTPRQTPPSLDQRQAVDGSQKAKRAIRRRQALH